MNRSADALAGSSARTLAAAALIVACGIAAYSNSFTDLFAGLDGKESIRDNPHSRRLWPLPEALSLPLWESRVVLDETPAIAHRPTFAVSLALITHFFGLEPWAHHAANLAIHIAAALVLFGIVRRTLARQPARSASATNSTWLAVASALIWVAHPLQTESVTFIAQRSESLMGLMLFLTLYCAIRSADDRRGWQAAAVAACLVGTGSKQTAALAPLLILLYDYIFSRPGTKWWRPAFYLALAAPAWIMLLTIAGKVAGHFEPERYLSYALAQPRVVVHYLRLTLWPDDLYVYVNTHLFDVDSAVDVVVPASILVALLIVTMWAIKRRHWLGFIGAWFFVTLGPTSSIIAIADVIQEHRMYVPLAALAVLAVVGGDALLSAVLAKRLRPPLQAQVKAALLLAIVTALATRTYVRNWDYHHEFAMIPPADLHEDYRILADHYQSRPELLQAEARRAEILLASSKGDPHDIAFAHFILALAHAENDEPQKAAVELERVLRLEPNFAYAHHRLGVALRSQGDLTGAIEHLREAIQLEPGFVYAYKELALAMKDSGETARASELLDQALRLQTRFGEGHYELGIMAVERGELDDAARHFERALRDRPDLAEAHYELGMVALKQRDPDRARHHFEATVRLQPDFVEAYFELGIQWRDRREYDRAAEHLGQAVRLRPDSADYHTELGWVLLKRGDAKAAADRFSRALAIDPEYEDAQEGLEELRALATPAAP